VVRAYCLLNGPSSERPGCLKYRVAPNLFGRSAAPIRRLCRPGRYPARGHRHCAPDRQRTVSTCATGHSPIHPGLLAERC